MTMPIKMTYNYTKNTILPPVAPSTLSTYGTSELCSTECSVFTWGNVDAFGSMALIWLPNEINNVTIENTISAIQHPELPPLQAIEYREVLSLKRHSLSGWFLCNNKYLIP